MAHIAAVNDPDVETFPGSTCRRRRQRDGTEWHPDEPTRPTDTRRARAFAAVAAVVLACTLAACSTGNDAAVYGGSFSFVSPGGQDRVLLPAATERGTVADLSGAEPGR